jgi:hypothetical protein
MIVSDGPFRLYRIPTLKTDAFLVHESTNATANDLSCTRYLRSGQSPFPRRSIAKDGRFVRVSILGPSHLPPNHFSRECVCIPSSIECIGSYSFSQCRNLAFLAFESRPAVTVLGASAFERCSSLVSICLPSSIQIIGNKCFFECKSLSNLTFEPGSELSTLPGTGFADCLSLRLICLPASLREVGGFSLANCGIESVSVDPRNRFLKVSGGFLVDFSGHSLVRCLGRDRDVILMSFFRVMSNQSRLAASVTAILYRQ